MVHLENFTQSQYSIFERQAKINEKYRLIENVIYLILHE